LSIVGDYAIVQNDVAGVVTGLIDHAQGGVLEFCKHLPHFRILYLQVCLLKPVDHHTQLGVDIDEVPH
jgi:hypothetical protein